MSNVVTGIAIWAVVLGLLLMVIVLAILIWLTWQAFSPTAPRTTAILIVFVVVPTYLTCLFLVVHSIWPLSY